MPIYEFKCNCGRKQEVVLSFDEHEKERFGICNKCNKPLVKTNQQINFKGYFSMNNSIKAKSYKKFNNKAGGPHGIVGKEVIGPSGVI